ncbi:hypothetical protein PF005_g14854 [Phytophthora fragariae]|uniref:Uncharacterized protein n=2 Tax=Phytophthora TaxID=4783 RepID=A0A6A3ELR2_9STRA|nr:hypothetical protein PF003_g33657 [Phytophthora fragariae]KAE9022148.1 hypothetical protein PR002_g12056 [Phytophthora rubi]KAE8933307.1 hypothetical protein PF009_g16683 [Phytophthora fragariae]KAE9003558.1 hypothetical protein PF011_g12854 [Phytophthora fragariae]KAE9027533.1 hypothetical protein PR001_g11938 [Phytophthora rubi]
MLTKQDVELLKSQVESAMEVLLRAADERVSWKQTGSASPPDTPAYAFLPGVYTSVAAPAATAQPHQQDDDSGAKVAPLKSAIPPLQSSPLPSAEAAGEGDGSKIRIVLHGDNTFEYMWTMKRSGARAMEFTVEMEGVWSKPVLNRTRRGEEDQRIFLSTKRARFQRLSNYDAENQSWKLSLRTLTRHGSDWANVGLTERGIPPVVMVFQCVNGCLESTGAALPAQILSNSPACRILAGLTKKIANKLGAPVDVMTEKWLPARGVRLAMAEDTTGVKVKQFNPFYCLADALRSGSLSARTEPTPPVSA